MTSVVIPAHNESAVIRRTLDAALAEAEPGEFEVIVACNGCTDDTAERARRPDVTVIEIEQASKVAALNAGDAAATSFPRIYLDADIELSTTALRLVRDALATAPAAAPLPRVDTDGASAPVRGYFAIWSRLGYTTRHLIGSGVYGLSEAGRARFGAFPDLIADDGFVYCQFTAEERVNPAGAFFTLRVPRTTKSLLKRRIRIVAGNIELDARIGRRPQAGGPSWHEVVRSDPRLLPGAPFFIAVNFVAGLAARRRAKAGTSGAWSADQSSRSDRAETT